MNTLKLFPTFALAALLIGTPLLKPRADVADNAPVHPSYDLMTIRPTNFTGTYAGRDFSGFTFGISAMDWLPDGRLVVATFYMPGADIGLDADPLPLFVLDGVMGNDRSKITAKVISGNFRDTHGMKIIGKDIYIVHKDKDGTASGRPGGLTKLTDTDGDGFYETQTSVTTDFRTTNNNFHHYNFGLPFKDGFFYVSLAQRWPPGDNGEDRGNMLKISLNGDIERFAGGLRSPNGPTLGPENEIFTCDNQGNWLPSNKLINVRKGRYYGFEFNGNNTFYKLYQSKQILKQSPPAVWFREGAAGVSPSEARFVKKGIFAGQMFLGDVNFGGLKRVFLERIKGEYQGCTFHFTGGLEAGIQKVLFAGDDQTLIMGGLGGPGTNFHWHSKRFALQKLTPNGKLTFEMLAVRSKANGFEIEFTKPLDESVTSTSAFSAETWHEEPEANYGAGATRGLKQLTIKSLAFSDDRKRVLLEIDPAEYLPSASWLVSSSSVHIKLTDAVKSKDGEKSWTPETWYTVNQIGPADKLGCKTAGFKEFDAAADYDDGLQCKTVTTTAITLEQQNTVDGAGFRVDAQDAQAIHFNLPFKQPYTLEIRDVRGTLMAQFTGDKPAEKVWNGTKASAGVYHASVRVGSQRFSRSFSRF